MKRVSRRVILLTGGAVMADAAMPRGASASPFLLAIGEVAWNLLAFTIEAVGAWAIGRALDNAFADRTPTEPPERFTLPVEPEGGRWRLVESTHTLVQESGSGNYLNAKAVNFDRMPAAAPSDEVAVGSHAVPNELFKALNSYGIPRAEWPFGHWGAPTSDARSRLLPDGQLWGQWWFNPTTGERRYVLTRSVREGRHARAAFLPVRERGASYAQSIVLTNETPGSVTPLIKEIYYGGQPSFGG